MRRNWQAVAGTVLTVLDLGLPVLSGSEVQGPPLGIADVEVQATRIAWHPQVDYERLVLTVSGPENFRFRQDFVPGQPPPSRPPESGGGPADRRGLLLRARRDSGARPGDAPGPGPGTAVRRRLHHREAAGGREAPADSARAVRLLQDLRQSPPRFQERGRGRPGVRSPTQWVWKPWPQQATVHRKVGLAQQSSVSRRQI